MKAILHNKYGNEEQITYQDVEKPTLIEDRILVKIHAASINQADVYKLQGKPFPLRLVSGLFKPKHRIMGSDVSGVIEEEAEGITDFKVGDEVFGQLVMSQDGGYAEYALMSPKQLTHKPSNVTFSEAASVTMAGLTALQGMRLANVTKDSRVLIYGASGGVGTFMIQVAKHLGAHVTAVCSTRNVQVALDSKADVVIDYKKTTGDERGIKYDVIIAANGYNKLSRYRDSLTDDGAYVLSGGDMKQMMDVMIKKPFLGKKGNKTFNNYVAKVTSEDLNNLADLLESKEITPHIDKEFPLEQTKDAFSHFMKHKTIGKTIIKVVN